MSELIRPVGPVDVLVVGFAENRFDGSISQAIGGLVARGLVRVLDVVIVTKDDDGTIAIAEVADVADGVVENLEVFTGDIPGLLGETDAAAAVESLPPGSTVAMVAWENTWAIEAAMAMRAAGGELLAHERIPAADVDAVMTALEELEAPA